MNDTGKRSMVKSVRKMSEHFTVLEAVTMKPFGKWLMTSVQGATPVVDLLCPNSITAAWSATRFATGFEQRWSAFFLLKTWLQTWSQQ